ncbi:MAG: hypothetical protein ACSLE5_15580 [Porticoccaceae bacterium]
MTVGSREMPEKKRLCTYSTKRSVIDAVNADGEFQISARFLDGALKLYFENDSLLFKFRDGKLATITPGQKFDSVGVTIKSSLANWREFLKPIPRPFLHDMFAAIMRNEFEWAGNSETFLAYYGAFRRMFQLMRQCAI